MARKKAKDTPQIYKSKISFDDIVGHKQIKKRLKAIIKIIKDPKKLECFDTPVPKGLLIYGPISVGKSMLAKAFAKEAKVSYYKISGSLLFELDHIKEVYKTAAKHAPCVVNIDSIAVLDNYFLSQQIEKRFLHWMDVAKEHTIQLVDKHWGIIEVLALKLIEQEIVESDKLSRIIGEKKISHTGSRIAYK